MYKNADGLWNKKHELLNFVVDISPKIIAITEGINNNPRRDIALYFNSSLNSQELPNFNNTDFKESLWASFDSQDSRKVLIGCVHGSPISADDNEQQLLTLLRDKSIGDFGDMYIG